ncbi:MAG TPA: substrate import-associated zinc metallohydrolase lipoprotein [Agriterribacter sp.]|nr:substrate import-associated zinc metallohydrolase lipoprotein [Agriterribacter sp.]
MKRVKNILQFLVLSFLLASCQKEEINPTDAENINGLGGDTWAKGPIDNWIYDTLTIPYNISVKYKWDQFEDLADITSILVPPKEEIVIPILSAVRKVWISPYIAEAGEPFFRKTSPKFFYMIGSPAYTQNGALKLGVAEGGRKIILLATNWSKIKGMPGYSPADSFWIRQMFITIHHEFAHILHQTILYPQDFKNLNPSLLTSNWTDYTDEQALRDGFITAYAMDNSDEDFVETISHLLVGGKAAFEAQLASIPDGITDRGTTREQAIARLRSKESIVVTYYKQVWGIDFYKLQSRVRAAVLSMIY